MLPTKVLGLHPIGLIWVTCASRNHSLEKGVEYSDSPSLGHMLGLMDWELGRDGFLGYGFCGSLQVCSLPLEAHTNLPVALP